MQHTKVKIITIVAWLTVGGTVQVPAAERVATVNGPAIVRMTDDGPILATPDGRSLYVYGPDDATPGKSACTDVAVRDMPDPSSGFGRFPLPGRQFLKSCAENWPPFRADAETRPSGQWSLIGRADGTKQWAYRGRPLYMSIRDQKPGTRNGLGASYFDRAWRLASAPLDFPPGLRIIRVADALVLATVNGRPVYTPRAGARVRNASAVQVLFQPVAAPYLAKLGGEWAAIDASPGERQFVFRDKALYAAPDSLSDRDILENGGWEMVVYHKGAGTPSEIQTRLTMIGDVYTDKNGKTLYTFGCHSIGCDLPGGPAAYLSALCGNGAECAKRWRPYLAAGNARSVGDWSVVDVANPLFTDPAGQTYPPDTPRVKAWAYRGRPVFTYYEDEVPGDIWGEALRWHLISQFQALRVPGRGLMD